TPLAGQPRLDEGVCDVPCPQPLELRRRRRERELLGKDPRRAFVGERHLQGGAQDAGGALAALAELGLDSLENILEQAWRAPRHAQHVERHDVARALPYRIDRRLAIIARQRGLLDIAIAA